MTQHLQRLTPVSWLLMTLPLTAGLEGCAPPQRTEAPAPIVEARRPAPQPVAAEQPPAPEPTRVYAYQPPSDAPPTEAAPAADETEPSSQTADVADPPARGNQTEPATTQAQPPTVVAQPTPRVPPPPTPEPLATPQVPAPPAPETQAPAQTALAPQQLPPAVDALVRQAESQRQGSDYAGAAATLERALRLQSREAYLWNRLAHVRLQQGLATQAANLAARANDLSGDRADLRRDNWLVIANAKRRSGDLQGAQDAERRAASGG